MFSRRHFLIIIFIYTIQNDQIKFVKTGTYNSNTISTNTRSAQTVMTSVVSSILYVFVCLLIAFPQIKNTSLFFPTLIIANLQESYEANPSPPHPPDILQSVTSRMGTREDSVG